MSYYFSSAYNAGDPGLIPGSERSPGEGNGNPLQYSRLENPMDGGAWYATVHGVAKSQIRLSNFTFNDIVVIACAGLSKVKVLEICFITNVLNCTKNALYEKNKAILNVGLGI